MPEKTRRGRNNLSPWTVKEMNFIEDNYGRLTVQEIGDTPGRGVKGGLLWSKIWG